MKPDKQHLKEWQKLKEYYIERLHAIDRLMGAPN